MTPIDFLICANLQVTLQGIRVADGYHHDLSATAVRLDPNRAVEDLIAPAGPRPFAVVDLLGVGSGEWEYVESPFGIERRIPVTVHWIHDSDPTDDTSRLKTWLEGCADVERAIAVDVTRGGYAGFTAITRCVFDSSADGAQVWATISLEVRLRRTFGQPDA